jgi:ribosomal-protein-alanine N-acetyltransferase
MRTELALRLATPADAQAIALLSRDTIEQGLPWTWGPQRVARAIRDANTNVVVAGAAEAIAGFGIMSYLETDAHLLLLAVHPLRRREGLASAILAWLEDVARAAGARRIRVEARRDNVAARSFYNEHAYHERAIREAMYSGIADGVRLEKWLRVQDDT